MQPIPRRYSLRSSGFLIVFLAFLVQYNSGYAQQDRFWGVHLDFHATPADTILFPAADSAQYTERFKTFLRNARPDFLQVDSKGHPGYTSWPSAYGSQAGLIGYDPLKLWSKLAHEQKIPLWLHYSGVQDEIAINKNPHWAALDQNGKPYKRATSLRSAYVDNLMVPQLVEAHNKYGITGVWVDGDCWGQEFDYSPAQLKAFYQLHPEQQTNSLPEPTNRLWAQFQRQQFIIYLTKLRQELNTKAPQLRTISNWAFSSHMPMPSIAGYSQLSGDLNPTNGVNSAHFEGRFLRSHTPSWDIMLWGHARNFNTGFRTLKTTEQTIQEAAHILALGGGVQVFFNMHRDGGPSKIINKPVKQLAAFVNQWRGLTPYHNTNWRSASDIAVLVPSTAVFNKMAANKSLYRAYNGEYNQLIGISHILQDAGLTYDYLIESDFDKLKLNRYKACIIPEADTLLPATVELIMNFKGCIIAGGPKVAYFLNRLTQLPQLKNADVDKVNTFIYNNDQIISLSTYVGLLPPSIQANGGARLGKTYTAPVQSGPHALYHKRNVLVTLFPLGVEYFKQRQSAMVNLVRDFLQQQKAITVYCEQASVSVVSYYNDKKNIVFLANRLGEHNNPAVYQESFIPAATDVKLFVEGNKPVKLKTVPASSTAVQPQPGGWMITVPRVTRLVRLEWE